MGLVLTLKLLRGKVGVASIREAERRIREIGELPRRVARHITSRPYLEMIGKLVSEEIVTEGRRGYGAEKDNATVKKFAPLRPATIKRREHLRAIGKLSDMTQPSKSNLTETAHMFDNLTYKVKQDGVKILFDDSWAKKKAFFAHNGSTIRKKRPFMFVSKKNIRQAIRLMEQARDDFIRSIL
jgi:hypothetical protein